MYCVIVLYNPSDNVVRRWTNVAEKCNNCTFIFVDNSIECNWSYSLDNCTYIHLKKNKGIAFAQNVGINISMEAGADFVLFFDQDSEVDASYCMSMLEEYKRVKTLVPNLAILGPTVINKETGEGYKSGGSTNKSGFVITNALISSGTIVETETLKVVGLMDDELFIDAVDFEWCWRAVSKGYTCARTESVKLPHKVGQKNKTILGVSYIISSPFRYYYQYRNWLWLIRLDYVPKVWKRNVSIRRVSELIIIPSISENKCKIICNMWKGIWAGLFKNKNV